jgi:hypothetical protein
VPRYLVTVPVTVQCVVRVEADSEGEALAVPISVESLFYENSHGGLSFLRNDRGVSAHAFSGVKNSQVQREGIEVRLDQVKYRFRSELG